MHKKTIRDIDVAGKTVVVRVDYNVPIDHEGHTEDVNRLEASLPTLNYLLDQNCKLVLISHLGRPDGKVDPKLSLRTVAQELSKIVNRPVGFVDNCVGKEAVAAAHKLTPREIVLLENVRFHPEEEANDADFAKQLASLGEVFVQDAFAVVHRAHASNSAITKFLPSVAGFLVEKEVTTITKAIKAPERPFVAIIGGAKVEDKADVMRNFIDNVDHLVVGGAIANTFFINDWYNYPVGKSLVDADAADEVADVLSTIKKRFNIESKTPEAVQQVRDFLILPEDDVTVAKNVEPESDWRNVTTAEVAADDIILDLGAASTKRVTDLIYSAGTVIWAGPVGMTELPQFARGSVAIAKAIVNSKAENIIGGGDTDAFVDEYGLRDGFDHISTGGGASLELMAGKKLPGVEALMDGDS